MRALLLLILGLAASAARSAEHAVVLLYHHVARDTPASTSVTPERFEAHLEYLRSGGFAVWPLERLLETVLVRAEAVPEDVVAITFDDAYASVLTEAAPQLRARGWPFTVFVNTDAVDAGHAPYLSWDQLRRLREQGATIGSHSASHDHLPARAEGEDARAWRARVAADLDRAAGRIEAELGTRPRRFAYPYGEDSAALRKVVVDRHAFALVQRSGAVGADTDPLAVPRFPLATGFAGDERFALAVNARPLPVREARPVSPGTGPRAPLERLVLTVAPGAWRADALACYAASGEALALAVSPHAEGDVVTVEVTPRKLQPPKRRKLNCTAPATDEPGAYHWYAYQWVVHP